MTARLKSIQAKVDMHQERMEDAIHSLRAWRKEKLACQETTEARLECKEATSEDMESEAEHRQVPKEHVAVGNGKAPNKRHRSWHLEAERR
jgi:hypothetical protein